MNSIYIKVGDLNKWVAKYFEKQDLITVEDLIATIEDLDSELEEQKEKYEELENKLNDNYEPISPYKMYGINERDFH